MFGLIAIVLFILISISLIWQLLKHQNRQPERPEAGQPAKALSTKVEFHAILLGVAIGLVGFEFNETGYAILWFLGWTLAIWRIARFTISESLLKG